MAYQASKKYVGVRKQDGATTWSYRYKVVVNGETYTGEKSGFSTALEASEARAKAIEELKTQGYVTETGKKVKDVFAEFIKSAEISRAYETIRKHNSVYNNHLYPAFGERYIASISGRELEEYLNSYKQSKKDAKHNKEILYSSEFVNSIYKTMFAVWSYAYKSGYIKENRMLQVEKVKERGRKKRDLQRLDEVQIAHIAEKARNTNLNPAFMITYFTGLRPAECFALLWSDIDFSERRLKVSKQLKYENGCWCLNPPKTPAANRWVYFNETLCNYLLIYKEQQRKEQQKLGAGYRDGEKIRVVTSSGEVKYITGLPFINRKPNGELLTTNSTKYIVRECKIEFGYDWKWYDLRATYASICANDLKLNPSFLRQQMGHTKIETTLRYYTDVDEALRFQSRQLIQSINIMPTPESLVFDELSTQGDMVYGYDDEDQSVKKVGNQQIFDFENGLLIERK